MTTPKNIIQKAVISRLSVWQKENELTFNEVDMLFDLWIEEKIKFPAKSLIAANKSRYSEMISMKFPTLIHKIILINLFLDDQGAKELSLDGIPEENQ